MPSYAYAIIPIGWIIWCLPFFLAQKNAQPAKEVDRRARWGILLVAISYSMLWQTKFWERPLPAWRLALSILFLFFACLLSWTGARALGRQWRFDAGLSADHELVTSGPYRFVRHPIYSSLLCLLLGMGFMVTPLPLLAAALLVFIIGTEIRVRIEDRLLATHFGERCREYQRSVPAYIPFLK
jgi:protein-S-isoprenylcysteine O-methyltransferase Ste14